MAKHGFFAIDTELHLEEPLDLFDRDLEEPYRSMTRVAGPPEGRAKDGGKRFDIGGKVGDNSVNESAQLVQKQSARRLREEPMLLKARTDCRPEVYLEAMDIEGVDVAVLMPTLMLGLSAMDDVDPQHMAALCRVYNNWAHEFTRGDPDRFKFWAWVPRQDATVAAEEARRSVEELGAVGAAMPSAAVNGNLLSDETFAPLWTELERLNVPLGLHPASGRARDDVRARFRGHRRTGRHAAHHRAPVLRGCVRNRADPGRCLRRLPATPGGHHGSRCELAAVAAVVDGRTVGDVRARR